MVLDGRPRVPFIPDDIIADCWELAASDTYELRHCAVPEFLRRGHTEI